MAAPMSAFHKSRCKDVMEKLQSYRISRMFAQPVDPERDNCPNYFEVIQCPMDIGTVNKKLDTNQYSTVEQWKSDVEQIWKNTILYNSSQALISVLAKQLQNTFKELTGCLSSDAEADWEKKFEELKQETNKIIKNAPKPPKEKTPKPQPVGAPPQKIPIRAPSAPPKQVPTTPKPSQKRFTHEEIIQLTDDINLVEDLDDIQKIIDLIKEIEPKMAVVEDDEVVIEISKLQSQTQISLRELVSKMLGR